MDSLGVEQCVDWKKTAGSAILDTRFDPRLVDLRLWTVLATCGLRQNESL